MSKSSEKARAKTFSFVNEEVNAAKKGEELQPVSKAATTFSLINV